METLNVYIPMDRRQVLARGADLPNRTHGAVLFADISGFTPLTEALAHELGPQRGAEELTHQLNHVYDALIEEVHRYGGSVIGFSGDAITCWFDRDDGRRAIACALKMQRAIVPFEKLRTPRGSEFSIRIKVAVTTGAVRRFAVGQPRTQRIDTLAGAIMDRLAAIEHEAQQGEVLVDAKALAAYQDQVAVREWRTGSSGERIAVLSELREALEPMTWPAHDTIADDIAREWLLPAVYERLQSGQGEFLAELRPAVALFLKFSGIDYDGDDAAGDKLDAYVRWVQDIVTERYDGSLLQLTIGDKGSYFYIGFGAPIAHEDDALRAIAAALELYKPPAHLSYIQDVQIGISRGLMRTGASGGAIRRTYGVLGKEVNVAARLMTMAQPGQILVTGRVKAEASGYDFLELGPTVLKGLSQPLPVFALLSQRQKQQAEDRLKGRSIAPMVGRDAERVIINEALQNLRTGDTSRCILIEGEAGIGKSRLVLDLLEQAQTNSIDMLVGTADAIDKSTPYYAWRPIFRQLFQLDMPDEEMIGDARHVWREQVLARLQQFDPDLVRLAPLLNAVLPLDFPENELTSQLIGSVRADNTHELLASLIKAMTNTGPLLLVLEDAHWMDSASWAVVRLIQRDVQSGLLFVIATRPFSETVPVEYTHLLQATHTQRIELETLSRDAINSLICQRLGITHLPQAVAQFIHDKVEGHPFFSEELAYALRDAELIQVIDGECRIAAGVRDLQALDFPDTIQGVITSRIDRLSPERQLALKVASVIGRIFAFRTLRDVHPVDSDKPHLRLYLDALQRLDITPLETPEPDLTYIFKHIITRDVAYNLMTFSQRRRLHRDVAQWYEHTHAADLASYYPYLAHHWRQSVSDQELEPDVIAKAIDLLEKAGEQALQSYANQEAIGFLREAIVLDDRVKLQQPLRRARWERQMGEAYLGLGKFSESRAHLEQALALLGQSIPGSRGSFVASLLGQTVRQLAHRVRKSDVGRQVPDESTLSEKDVMHLEAARVFTTLGNLYYFANEANLLLYAVMRSINLVEGIGPSPEVAQAYSNLCVISGLIQLHSLAETYSRLAQAACESVGQLPTQVFVLLRINLYRTGVGRWQEAEEGLRHAMEISNRLGDRVNWIGAAAVLFVGYGLQGKFTRNIELAIEVRSVARRINNAAFEVWGLNAQAYSELLGGRSEEAVRLNDATQKLLPEVENTDRVAKMDAQGLLVKLHLYQDDMDLVKQDLDTLAMLVAQSSPTAHAVFNAYDTFAEAALALWEANQQGQESEFESRAMQACKSLNAYARVFPAGRPRALLRQGMYDWLTGKPDKAGKNWQTALAKAETLEMPYDQALAHYTIGRHLTEDDPGRQENLKRASDFFAELGAVYDQSRVQALLENEPVLQPQ